MITDILNRADRQGSSPRPARSLLKTRGVVGRLELDQDGLIEANVGLVLDDLRVKTLFRMG